MTAAPCWRQVTAATKRTGAEGGGQGLYGSPGRGATSHIQLYILTFPLVS